MTTDLLWLFAAHFLADFVMQSRDTAKNKSSHFPTLLWHLLHHWLVFYLVALFAVGLAPQDAAGFSTVNAMAHGVIDWNIWRLYKRRVNAVTSTPKTYKFWEDHWFWVFVGLDQFLHALTMIVLYGVIK